MGKDIVLVVDKLSANTKKMTREIITQDAEVIYSDGNAELIEQHLKNAKILASFTDGVSAQRLAKAENCIYIQKFGAGYNNIAVSDASARGIPVGNTPGLNSRSVAELALTLILSVCRQTVVGHNAIVQDGKWLKTVLRDRNHELTGKTVGIIGFGNIGKNLRRLLSGFDCQVLYYDAFRLSPEAEQQLNISFCEICELLSKSDVVSLHCPLTEENRHLINEETLALMKDDAILINCARGGLIDEAALFAAMQRGKLLGAGLDTFESEPVERTNPLCTLPNVVFSPHNGGGTVEAVSAVVKSGCENINAMLKSGKPVKADMIVNRKELGL